MARYCKAIYFRPILAKSLTKGANDKCKWQTITSQMPLIAEIGRKTLPYNAIEMNSGFNYQIVDKNVALCKCQCMLWIEVMNSASKCKSYHEGRKWVFTFIISGTHIYVTTVTPFPATTRANNLWPVDVFLFVLLLLMQPHGGDRKCTKPGTNFISFEGGVGNEGLKDTHKKG